MIYTATVHTRMWDLRGIRMAEKAFGGTGECPDCNCRNRKELGCSRCGWGFSDPCPLCGGCDDCCDCSIYGE